MGAQHSRHAAAASAKDAPVHPGLRELHRRAETGVFSDSESDRFDASDSDGDGDDTDDDGSVWMALPSALSSTGRTFRKVETSVVDEEEQLKLVKRRARAARKLQRKSPTTAAGEEETGEAMSPRDFQRIKVIGVGGMGRVLLVRHRRDDKLYAMKVVSKRSVKEKDMAARVLSERDVLGGTSHHALVHLYWAFQTKSHLYFVMEYCPGGELSTHLERATMFAEEVAAFYAAELLLAVQQLHQHGIVHRDIKPENVLLTEDGHLKLVDFGISKFGITQATSGAQTICGSYEYLAPEILRGEEYGTAADWWAFGAVLYELLTGLPPWYSQNPEEMCERVLNTPLLFPYFMSSEAKDLLRKLLHQNPSERLGSSFGGPEIKEHVFFRHIDWEMVTFRETQAPIRPCESPETVVDGTNFLDEFTHLSIGSIDSSTPRVGGSESFKGFNFEAPEDQQIEYGYTRDVSLPSGRGDTP
ncbi:AGC protein Kinase [Phytophthora cinnamomi]|uniref:AGC protein Kinase n=1 Tax=Phytophthora cinnamomi TaxID=4785 RepID=UPI003559EEF5|nr:AGC protein Kinase [Phytophthora cinnamomi]